MYIQLPDEWETVQTQIRRRIFCGVWSASTLFAQAYLSESLGYIWHFRFVLGVQILIISGFVSFKVKSMAHFSAF